MLKKIDYFLPDDNYAIASAIKAIPDTWSWVDGRLQAPDVMLASGEASFNVRFCLNRFGHEGFELLRSIDPQTESSIPPDIHAVVVERKRPFILCFEEAGYEYSSGLTLANMKRVATAYVHLGYRGSLRFYSGCRSNQKYDNPAKCLMEMDRGSIRALLAYNTDFGGKLADLDPIVAACDKLGLKRLEADG